MAKLKMEEIVAERSQLESIAEKSVEDGVKSALLVTSIYSGMNYNAVLTQEEDG